MRWSHLSCRLVFAALGLIVLATAVEPPLAAFALNRAGVRVAFGVVRTLAVTLDKDERRLYANGPKCRDVLCGRADAAGTVASGAMVGDYVACTWGGLGIDGGRLRPDPWGTVTSCTSRPREQALWCGRSQPVQTGSSTRRSCRLQSLPRATM